MGKAKLAICIGDVIYQERFVRCLMNHYRERYELHVFHSTEELAEMEYKPFHGYILGEAVADEINLSEEHKKVALILRSDNKYQEVYKLIEKLELLLGDCRPETGGAVNHCTVGIYSFTLPHLQLPLAAILSGIYGERGKAILLDFQTNSGFIRDDGSKEQTIGMEDVLAMAMEESYNKPRCLSAIGHDSSWDYVYPVKSTKGLAEVNAEILRKVVRFLTEEMEYEIVLINMGEGTMDIGEFMGICNQVYLLYPKGDNGSWREKSYVDEMERRGKDEVLHRIHRIEISSITGTDRNWERLVEQWKWNSVGDYLRKVVWGAGTSG